MSNETPTSGSNCLEITILATSSKLDALANDVATLNTQPSATNALPPPPQRSSPPQPPPPLTVNPDRPNKHYMMVEVPKFDGQDALG